MHKRKKIISANINHCFSEKDKKWRENLIEKLELVTREEFNVLKKIVQKQEMKIKQLQKKKIKKAKRS